MQPSIFNNWYKQFLACPDCGANIEFNNDRICCLSCNYNRINEKPLNLKPIDPSPASLIMPRIYNNPDNSLVGIEISRPHIIYHGPQAIRNSNELMSEIQNYLKEKSRVLDLGCGPRDQSIPLEYLGHEYVGVDYSNPAADIIADAHALPFKPNTFDCVLMYSVL